MESYTKNDWLQQPVSQSLVISKEEGGFTLLELLVVCTLITIMMAVSVPALRNSIFTDELKASTRKIIGIVKGVRERAIREQVPMLLKFDVEEGKISCGDGTKDEDDSTLSELDLPSSVEIVNVLTSSNTQAELSVISLWVSKRGYMDHTIIQLRDNTDSKVSIIFSPFLGSIEVVDEHVSLE